jgi:hypothetical protein
MPDTSSSISSAQRAFQDLLVASSLPRRLDIVQLQPVWRAEAAARSRRAELDARIFDAFLRSQDIHVRRLVLYDLPSDEGGDVGSYRRADAQHRAWVGALVRDLFYLGMPALQTGAPYRIKHLILDRVDRRGPLPIEDGWSDGSQTDWQQRFEQVWRSPEAIDNNLAPPEYPRGPRADRDPRWYLWT